VDSDPPDKIAEAEGNGGEEAESRQDEEDKAENDENKGEAEISSGRGFGQHIIRSSQAEHPVVRLIVYLRIASEPSLYQRGG